MPLAEIDLGQVIIVVIAMVAGFVQWLIGLLKQSQEARERRAASPPGDDRPAPEPRQPSTPRPAAPPPVHDPWGGMREILEQLKPEPPRQPAAPPRGRRQPRAAASPTPAVAVVSPAPAPAPAPVAKAAVAAVPPAPADPLLAFLRQPDALRQAVVLREVLGPPKALQSPDSAAC